MSGPAELVTGAYNDFFGYATAAFNATMGFIGDLQAIAIPEVQVNVEYQSPDADLPEFTLPAVPVVPTLSFAPGTVPTAPTVPVPALPAVITPPSFSKEAPVLSQPAVPSPLSAAQPGDAPSVADVTIPTAPALTPAPLPSLREITLPSVPTLSLPSFSAVAPLLNIDLPAVGIVFSEQAYTSALLAETTARVRAMLAGGTGLPADVENALFERARGRLDMTAFKATQEATEQFAARGFSEPGGDLAARLAEIREQNRDAVNNLSRDILIRVHEVEIENLRFAVQQGIALESVQIQAAGALAQRALEAQRLIAETAIQVYNAKVALYNAALAGYRTEADVFRTRIDAEIARLQIYKTQIEAQGLIAQLNETDVKLYAEQNQVLVTLASLYESQIRAVQARVDVDRARIEGYRAKVEGFAALVNAKKTEFEAYGEQVKANTSIIEGYKAETEAFAERVRAYQSQTEATLAIPRLQIETGRLTLDQYQAQLGAYRENVNAQSALAQSQVSLFDGRSRLYSAQLGAEGARVESTARRFQLAVESARTQATIGLENAKTNITNALQAISLMIENLKTQGQLGSQVAAGALSAVNLSASIQGQDSTSRNLNVSYSIDGGEAAPPAIG